MKLLIFICRYVEPFRSYALPMTATLENWVYPSPKFLGVEEKKIESRLSALTLAEFVCKCRGDPLRDGQDQLSRKSGRKERNKGTVAEHIAVSPATRDGRLRKLYWKQVSSATRLKQNDCFTARRIYASAVLGVVILSVCPSLRLSHTCFVTKANNALRIFWYHTKEQSL